MRPHSTRKYEELTCRSSDEKARKHGIIIILVKCLQWSCFFSVIICRMPDDRLVKTVLLRSVDNMRQRERPLKSWTDNITDWTDLTPCEAVRLSEDRATWSKR